MFMWQCVCSAQMNKKVFKKNQVSYILFVIDYHALANEGIWVDAKLIMTVSEPGCRSKQQDLPDFPSEILLTHLANLQ